MAAAAGAVTSAVSQAVATTAAVSGAVSSALLAILEAAAGGVSACAASFGTTATAAAGAAGAAAGPALGALVGGLQQFAVVGELPATVFYSVLAEEANATTNATSSSALFVKSAPLRRRLAWADAAGEDEGEGGGGGGQGAIAGGDAPVAVADMAALGGGLAWANADVAVPRGWLGVEAAPTDAERAALARELELQQREEEEALDDAQVLVGDSPVSYLVDVVLTKRRSFHRLLFWGGLVCVVLGVAYVPAVWYAKSALARVHAKERRHKAVHWNTRPPTLLERFVFSAYPRVPHYLALLFYQGACKSCAFALADGTGSTNFSRAAGFIVLLVFNVGFLVYVWRVVHVKVRRERRAALRRDAATGALRWVDAKPANLQKGGSEDNDFWFSGFVSGNGVCFEDFKARPGAAYALSVMLAQRFLVGVVVGGVVSAPGGAASAQATALLWLMCVYGVYIVYLGWQAPFLVPLANLAEIVVACLQLACVFLSLLLLQGTLPAAQVSSALHYLVLGACGGMALRTMASTLPMLFHLPRHATNAVQVVAEQKKEGLLDAFVKFSPAGYHKERRRRKRRGKKRRRRLKTGKKRRRRHQHKHRHHREHHDHDDQGQEDAEQGGNSSSRSSGGSSSSSSSGSGGGGDGDSWSSFSEDAAAAPPVRRAGGTGFEPTLGMKTEEERRVEDELRQAEDMVELGRLKPPSGARQPQQARDAAAPGGAAGSADGEDAPPGWLSKLRQERAAAIGGGEAPPRQLLRGASHTRMKPPASEGVHPSQRAGRRASTASIRSATRVKPPTSQRGRRGSTASVRSARSVGSAGRLSAPPPKGGRRGSLRSLSGAPPATSAAASRPRSNRRASVAGASAPSMMRRAGDARRSGRRRSSLPAGIAAGPPATARKGATAAGRRAPAGQRQRPAAPRGDPSAGRAVGRGGKPATNRRRSSVSGAVGAGAVGRAGRAPRRRSSLAMLSEEAEQGVVDAAFASFADLHLQRKHGTTLQDAEQLSRVPENNDDAPRDRGSNRGRGRGRGKRRGLRSVASVARMDEAIQSSLQLMSGGGPAPARRRRRRGHRRTTAHGSADGAHGGTGRHRRHHVSRVAGGGDRRPRRHHKGKHRRAKGEHGGGAETPPPYTALATLDEEGEGQQRDGDEATAGLTGALAGQRRSGAADGARRRAKLAAVRSGQSQARRAMPHYEHPTRAMRQRPAFGAGGRVHKIEL